MEDILSSEDESSAVIPDVYSNASITSDDDADVNDDNDGRVLILSQVRKVTQTVTLTFRRTITYVQDIQTHVDNLCMTKSKYFLMSDFFIFLFN